MMVRTFVLVLSSLACGVFSGLGGPTAAPTRVFPTFGIPSVTPTATLPPYNPILLTTPTPTPRWPVATLGIVSSLPLRGSFAAPAAAMVNAEKLRLQQSGYLACRGKYKLAYEAWNNGADTELEAENARKAAETPAMVAYLGGFDDDLARAAIPILNQAGPLVMISTGAAYPGLTKPVFGIPDEPDIYYPAGMRNFARVVTAYDVQARTAAAFLYGELGVRSVYILDDTTAYGQIMSDAFESSARVLGMQVTGHEAVDPKSRTYKPVMERIAASTEAGAPDAIFAGMLVENNAAQLLQDKVTVLGDNMKVKFIGVDGLYARSFLEVAGPSAAGMYVVASGSPFPAGLTERGRQFVKDYEALNGSLKEPAAVYAYEAMSVLLKAIDDLCAIGGDPTDRKQVRDALFAVQDFQGILGTWGFAPNGDTTLVDITVYEVKGGKYEAVRGYQ